MMGRKITISDFCSMLGDFIYIILFFSSIYFISYGYIMKNSIDVTCCVIFFIMFVLKSFVGLLNFCWLQDFLLFCFDILISIGLSECIGIFYFYSSDSFMFIILNLVVIAVCCFFFVKKRIGNGRRYRLLFK